MSYALEKVFRMVGEAVGLADSEWLNIRFVDDFPNVNGSDAVCKESFGRLELAPDGVVGEVRSVASAAADSDCVKAEGTGEASEAQLVVDFRVEVCMCGAGGVIGMASMIRRIEVERQRL